MARSCHPAQRTQCLEEHASPKLCSQGVWLPRPSGQGQVQPPRPQSWGHTLGFS